MGSSKHTTPTDYTARAAALARIEERVGRLEERLERLARLESDVDTIARAVVRLVPYVIPTAAGEPEPKTKKTRKAAPTKRARGGRASK